MASIQVLANINAAWQQIPSKLFDFYLKNNISFLLIFFKILIIAPTNPSHKI